MLKISGSNRYNVTSVPTQAASFTSPTGIAVDSSGNAFITEQNVIWKLVIATGALSVVAGSGAMSFADGTGTMGSFSQPVGIVVDSNGIAFIADLNNNRIRRLITATGVSTTFAGNSAPSFVDGVGTNAGFKQVNCITIDSSGNLFVTDLGNYRVRKIVVSTAVVSTVAGSGSNSYLDGVGTAAAFGYLRGIVADAVGNVFVSDMNRIRMVNVATGLVSTLAGGSTSGFLDGTGTQALLNYPRLLALDKSGTSVLVPEHFGYRIRQVAISTQVVTSAAGNGVVSIVDGVGSSASFQQCLGAAVDADGNVIVTDNGRIRLMQAFSACQVGQYCPPASAVATACPIGSFCATTGISAPTACTLGSYCNTTGMSTVVPCMQGSYCPQASNASNACPAGSFCANSSSIASCLPGAYCPARSTASLLCPVGYYCNATGLSAVAGSCSAGFYCPSGSSSPTQVPCAAGYFCASGSAFNARGAVDGQGMMIFHCDFSFRGRLLPSYCGCVMLKQSWSVHWLVAESADRPMALVLRRHSIFPAVWRFPALARLQWPLSAAGIEFV